MANRSGVPESFPGVSLCVATGAIKLRDVDPGHLVSDVWPAVYGRLGDWVANGPGRTSKFGMSSPDGPKVEFGGQRNDSSSGRDADRR